MTGVAKCLFGKWVVCYEEICDKTKTKKENILPLKSEKKNLRHGEEVNFKKVKNNAELL